MTKANEPCVDDVGTNFDITIKEWLSGTHTVVDLTGATSLSFVFEFPSGETKTRTASIQDAANGLLRYTTEAGDLSEAGQLIVQPQFTVGSWTGCGNPPAVFEVGKKH